MIVAPLFLALLVATDPQATPPPEIEHTQTTYLCTTVRHRLESAVSMIRSNDNLIDRGDHILGRMGFDVIAAADGPSATGGQGVGLQMDEMQLESLLDSLQKNLDEADALLNNSAPTSNPTTERERRLLSAKRNLQTVITQQRASINLLYEVARSNEVRDLQSRKDPIPDDVGGRNMGSATGIVDSRPLHYVRTLTQQAESEANPAIATFIDSCTQ